MEQDVYELYYAARAKFLRIGIIVGLVAGFCLGFFCRGLFWGLF